MGSNFEESSSLSPEILLSKFLPPFLAASAFLAAASSTITLTLTGKPITFSQAFFISFKKRLSIMFFLNSEEACTVTQSPSKSMGTKSLIQVDKTAFETLPAIS